MSLVGLYFSAPTSHGSSVEGVVTSHNEATGEVALADDDKEIWKGFEYQLETVNQ
jgi:hypothetical protein